MNAEISFYYKKSFADFKMERMHTHSPNNFEIMYVREGSCLVKTEEDSFFLSRGEFILLGNECPHLLEARQAAILNIEFNINAGNIPIGEVLAEYPVLSQLFSARKVKISDRSGVLEALLCLISELKENEEGLCSRLMFCRLLIEIARSFSRREEGPDTYVRAACEYIGEHFCEKLSVGSIAAEVGINRSYLQTLFRRVTGKTVVEYINSLRIEKACFIMKNTDLPAVDIAIDCGFSSRQHFMYIFKKHTGCTARQYRTGRENYERN